MLRQVIILSFLVLAAGIAAARFADQSDRAGVVRPTAATAVAAAPAAPVTAPQSAYSSSVVVTPDARGHFLVDARVDARPMAFMIDTGATVIALREGDAAALGIHPAARDFTTEVKTANGSLRGAPTQLDMVEVGGLMVRDVPALILPDQALSENLLGLSFLRRLRRFEYSDGRLVLEQ
jgi:aspartyl protease family protein